MQPFDTTYMLMKSDSIIVQLLKMGRADDAQEMQAMRQFVLDNTNSPDPQKREQAEEMYQYLTQLMSYLDNPMASETPQRPTPPPAPEVDASITGQGSPQNVVSPEDEIRASSDSPIDLAWGIIKSFN